MKLIDVLEAAKKPTCSGNNLNAPITAWDANGEPSAYGPCMSSQTAHIATMKNKCAHKKGKWDAANKSCTALSTVQSRLSDKAKGKKVDESFDANDSTVGDASSKMWAEKRTAEFNFAKNVHNGISSICKEISKSLPKEYRLSKANYSFNETKKTVNVEAQYEEAIYGGISFTVDYKRETLRILCHTVKSKVAFDMNYNVTDKMIVTKCIDEMNKIIALNGK